MAVAGSVSPGPVCARASDSTGHVTVFAETPPGQSLRPRAPGKGFHLLPDCSERGFLVAELLPLQCVCACGWPLLTLPRFVTAGPQPLPFCLWKQNLAVPTLMWGNSGYQTGVGGLGVVLPSLSPWANGPGQPAGLAGGLVQGFDFRGLLAPGSSAGTQVTRGWLSPKHVHRVGDVSLPSAGAWPQPAGHLVPWVADEAPGEQGSHGSSYKGNRSQSSVCQGPSGRAAGRAAGARCHTALI